MTTYIYKGQSISHIRFISILRYAGINGGHRLSAYEALVKCASLGKEKAIKILNDHEVIEK